MKVALAFHDCSKGKESPNGLLYDTIIRIVTQSSLVHVETAFVDKNLTSTTCFSAVPDLGCRFTTIDLTQPEWVMVSVDWDYQLALKAAHDMNGMPYDTDAILTWFVPWHPHDKKDRFCSEVGTDIGKYCGDPRLVKLVPWHTSPVDLYNAIRD